MITERNVAKVHQFYEELLFTIESLETLGNLESVQAMAYYVLVKKLEFLRSELVSHVPSDWRSWSFKELLEALHKWTDTNTTSSKRLAFSDRVFFSEDQHVNNSCVYCDSTGHASLDCGEISMHEEYLVSKRLCFNCAAGQHNANKCRSKLSCHTCRRRHHTSLCQQASEPSLKTNIAGSSVIHLVVIVDVNGRKFRAHLDSGASQSYVSSTLIDLIGAHVVRSGTRRVATLLGVTTTKLQEYDFCLRAVKRRLHVEHACHVN